MPFVGVEEILFSSHDIALEVSCIYVTPLFLETSPYY